MNETIIVKNCIECPEVILFWDHDCPSFFCLKMNKCVSGTGGIPDNCPLQDYLIFFDRLIPGDIFSFHYNCSAYMAVQIDGEIRVLSLSDYTVRPDTPKGETEVYLLKNRMKCVEIEIVGNAL